MGLQVTEDYPTGKVSGEAAYELVSNARVPFILAKEAPVLSGPTGISGVFVSYTVLS